MYKYVAIVDRKNSVVTGQSMVEMDRELAANNVEVPSYNSELSGSRYEAQHHRFVDKNGKVLLEL